ncbi:protein NOI4-like isoform X2 [Tripterygium wilfordii]|uniref:protein NOI4-like isoform X2 n=1 Tax=Tripterygium wilfordii TaxID=458696 RepID=UPI0018F81E17|nr:protein NOI4-like isoform X2 [Tripterygium wilfordii]
MWVVVGIWGLGPIVNECPEKRRHTVTFLGLQTHPSPGSSFAIFMASDRGLPLPKFGEWDVNNPASAEGFTVIFNKARNEKKTKATAGVPVASPTKNETAYDKTETYQHPPKKKWLCCG